MTDQVDYSWLILTRATSRSELDRRFGHTLDQWIRLRSRLEDDDELWEFECGSNCLHQLSGAAGIAVKREGSIVDHLVTSQTFD